LYSTEEIENIESEVLLHLGNFLFLLFWGRWRDIWCCINDFLFFASKYSEKHHC